MTGAPWVSEPGNSADLPNPVCTDFHPGVEQNDPVTDCDCNVNGTRDPCDLEDGTSQDCNGNGIPDECDIASGRSEDADGNSIPDECCENLADARFNLDDGAPEGDDGHLDTDVDGFGSTVSWEGAGHDDRYAPPGPGALLEGLHFTGGVFLFVLDAEGNGTHREPLSSSGLWQAVEDGQGVPFGDGDGLDDTLDSSFTVQGAGVALLVDENQSVGPPADGVAALVQSYTVTNQGQAAIPLRLLRCADVDLTGDGDFTNDGVGVATDGKGNRFVYERDPGDAGLGLQFALTLAPQESRTVRFVTTCGFFCPGDLNGDGQVNFADLLLILASWAPCPDCPEDIDGSGAVDFEDLLIVLNAWGPCPPV